MKPTEYVKTVRQVFSDLPPVAYTAMLEELLTGRDVGFRGFADDVSLMEKLEDALRGVDEPAMKYRKYMMSAIMAGLLHCAMERSEKKYTLSQKHQIWQNRYKRFGR